MREKAGDINRVISRIRDLPTLPATVIRITQIVNNPKASARDLARIITDDQVLTARLLRLVNSSFYGFPQRISTVTGAIVLLGFDAIRNLLLSTSIFKLFKAGSRDLRFRLDAFWDHSVGCALGAKIVATHLRYEQVEELFVAGLLHDIGKVLELLYLPQDFERVAERVEADNILIEEAEREIWGFGHAELGAALADAWRLPAKLVEVIGFHHTPDRALSFPLETSIVHVADILCRALDLGSGGDHRMPRLNDRAWENLGLDVAELTTIIEEIDAGFSDIKALIRPS